MNKQLSIAFLDFDDIRNPLLAAGQAKATMETGKRLVAKGHNVIVYCARYPGSEDRLENGILYKHIGPTTSNIRLNNILYILLLPFIVPSIKADIIVECFTAPVSTLLSPLWTSIPVVGMSTSFEAERFSKLYHFPFDLVEKYGCKLYKYFISFSDSLVDKITSFNPAIETRVIPYGIDKEYIDNVQGEPEHILFLGRLDMGQKGIDLLLKAYKNYENDIKYPLFIGGHGPDKEKIQALIDSLGLTEKVKLVGSLYGEKKLDYLSRAVCLAVSSRQESFGLVALEGLASGLPVITFDIPGFSWIKKELILQAPLNNIDVYGRQLMKACKDAESQSIKDKRRFFAKNFTWNKTTDQYEKFFRHIIAIESQVPAFRISINRQVVFDMWTKVRTDYQNFYKFVAKRIQ